MRHHELGATNALPRAAGFSPRGPSFRDWPGRSEGGACRFLALVLLILLGSETGCSLHFPRRPIRIDLAPDVERPEKSVVIFLVDGLDRTRLGELLDAGQLPNIKERFVEGGVRVEHAVSSMPSVTYPNCSSFITGVFPGHHDILGNFWFDRRTLECRDYMTYDTYRTVNDHLRTPTLFELLDDRFTLNIQSHTRRGVRATIDNERVFAWCWVLGRFVEADRCVSHCFEEAADLANRVKCWPTVIMTYYPGVDEVGHRFGPDSDEYTEALCNIDGVVGYVTDALDDAGLGDSTYCILVSDHGMAPVGRSRQIDICRWLRDDRGLTVRTGVIDTNNYPPRYELMDGYDAVASVNAGRVATIHLRGRRGWFRRPDPQEVLEWMTASPAVHELPAVELAVARAGPDRVRVLSRQGTAIMERKREGGQKLYRVAECEGDPLGYHDEPGLAAFVAAGWHGSREWLAETARSRCPDFVPQVVEMFDSDRTGDVVLMAAEGWAFYRGEAGGHGSCLARDMSISLFFAGPDLPRGATIRHARLVDVMPTILGLLDEEQRLERIDPIDGINLASQLRTRRP